MDPKPDLVVLIKEPDPNYMNIFVVTGKNMFSNRTAKHLNVKNIELLS